MENQPAAVLVTGISGFLGLHTALRMLENGFAVRGTVRTEALGKDVKGILSRRVNTDRLEIIPADLMRDDAWEEAVRGCRYVLHVASPFPRDEPGDENELILPAREGTRRVLRAAHAANVERVVVVSSAAAVNGGHSGENRVFNGSDWTDLSKQVGAYAKSKTLAEQAAWDFIHGTENIHSMEMAAVNPSVIFGPLLDERYHTSMEWFLTLLRAEVPGVARTQLDMVDVRDTAEMIQQAMLVPAASGQRFLCHAASIPLSEFAGILKQHFSGRGYRVPDRVMPNILVRLVALLMPKTRGVAGSLGRKYDYDTEPARTILGWQARPYEQTIIEMAESMIEKGLV